MVPQRASLQTIWILHPFHWIQEAFPGLLHHLSLRYLQGKDTVGVARKGLQPAQEGTVQGLFVKESGQLMSDQWSQGAGWNRERRNRTPRRWECRRATTRELSPPSTFICLFSRFGQATVFGFAQTSWLFSWIISNSIREEIPRCPPAAQIVAGKMTQLHPLGKLENYYKFPHLSSTCTAGCRRVSVFPWR